MGIKYISVENGYVLKGEALRNVQHKEVLYTGGFYEKELEDTKAGVYVGLLEGDKNLVDYRDEILKKEKGWKSSLVGLISSYVTVVYLVTRGVLYEPFRSPLNFIHNENSLRLQVMGRKGKELSNVDDEFLEWVLKMIAFILSDKPESTFKEYELIDYARGLGKEEGKMLSRYMDNRNLDELFEYTIEESLRSVLDDYLTIGRVPKDDKPSINELKIRIDQKERERIKKEDEEERLRLEEIAKEEELIRKRNELLAKEKEDNSLRGKIKKIFNKDLVKVEYEDERKKKDFTANQKLLRENDIHKYREELGVGEDRQVKNFTTRVVFLDVITNLVGAGLLGGAIYVAYMFYIWLIN